MKSYASHDAAQSARIPPIYASNDRRATRRRFIRNVVVGTAATLAAPAILRGRNLNEKLNIAIIGTGGRGAANMRAVESENIVALCDVYEPNLRFAAQRHPRARQERDFRRLFDHANEFDAVVVSTTEHTHAFATLPALQLGKHVYCEKPLTHNVWEARVVREAAERAGVATQMGTQIHAGENYRRVVEIIRSGLIGPVSEVHVWVSRAWGWQTAEEANRYRDIVHVMERPAEEQPVPSGLDWELWIGPAPMRPFHEVYFPGPKWYRWWDFGNGTMSDLGSHWVDLPYWALELDYPVLVEAEGPPPHPEIAPASMHVRYEYPQRNGGPQVTLHWYQGSYKPAVWHEDRIPRWDNGVLFIGQDGMVLADYGKFQLLPEDKFRDVQLPEPFLPRSPGHHAEWILAAKTGQPTGSPFEYAGRLTEANHLGNVAYRTGKAIQWDWRRLAATNAPEADQYIRREYRKGWKLV
ncbi:MAG: oxidoreductase [Pirellulaceae bacterium]|nr:MAG: oxidoreductase [Pirellulaceae bacterium]